MNVINYIRDSLRQFGVVCTMQDVALRAINRVVLLQIAKGVTVDHVPAQFAGCPQPYKAMFLDETMLRRFSKDPENLLAEDFLDEALSKGDQCYAILDSNGALAAYGWYARSPTTMDPADLRLSFDRHYVYMYKGYTHAHYRGKRLHAIGMIGALQHYLKLGYKGLVSHVESNNFSSLKSCYRMGCTDFGSIWVLRTRSRCVWR